LAKALFLGGVTRHFHHLNLALIAILGAIFVLAVGR